MDNQVLRPAFSEVLPTEVVTGSYAILTGSDEHGMKKWKLIGSWRQSADWFQPTLLATVSMLTAWCHDVTLSSDIGTEVYFSDVVIMTSYIWRHLAFFLDCTIGAAFFVRIECIVKEIWLVISSTTFGLGLALSFRATVRLIIESGGGPESVIVRGELGHGTRLGKTGGVHVIALEQCPFACTWWIALWNNFTFIIYLPPVFNSLGDALISKFHFCTVNTFFVIFAKRIKSVNGLSNTTGWHGTVTKH